MTAERKGSGLRRPDEWFVRFRPAGLPAAHIERCADGWHVVIGLSTAAITDTRQAAIAVVDQLDTVHRKG
jgi:hypothetical protein